MKIEVNKVPRLLGIGLFYGFWLLGLAGYLTHLLTGAMPDPIAFAPLALFDVYWYGIILLGSILIGGWLVSASFDTQLDRGSLDLWDAPVLIIIVGLLSARLLDIIFVSPIANMQGIHESADYWGNPSLFFSLNWGGLNIWGGMIGVGTLLVILAIRKQKSIGDTLFKAVIGLLAISCLSAWGHFINQELYGIPTRSMLGLMISPEFRLPQFSEFDRFVPLFLLSSAWNLLGTTWLLFDKRWRLHDQSVWDGATVGLIWFIVGRLFVELVTPNTLFNWLPASLFILLIVLLAFRQHFRKVQ